MSASENQFSLTRAAYRMSGQASKKRFPISGQVSGSGPSNRGANDAGRHLPVRVFVAACAVAALLGTQAGYAAPVTPKEARPMETPFALEALVDFPDDALTTTQPITPKRI